MRLIDADDLYYKVKCNCNPYGKPTIDFESGKKVLDWIEKAQTISWIPVEERLPEKSGWYAVCVEKYGRLTLELSLHVEGEPWCADNAVAWLPLPKPYEKEGE